MTETDLTDRESLTTKLTRERDRLREELDAAVMARVHLERELGAATADNVRAKSEWRLLLIRLGIDPDGPIPVLMAATDIRRRMEAAESEVLGLRDVVAQMRADIDVEVERQVREVLHGQP